MIELGGYVTDVPYVLGFKPMVAPAWLDHVALLWGYEPPARDAGFTWCDLGCGQGVTAAILAATHPGGTFYGIDAMPVHIAHARRLADAAGIGNVTFEAADFTAAAELSLPRFDYIVAHGVYTWVDEPTRAALRAFIDRHLAPGGLVYISYNAMPGWLSDLPFQRLARELGAAAPGDGAARFAAAAAIIDDLAAADTPALQSSYILRELAQHPQDYPAGYLVHEFMHAGWEALYVTDVRRAFAKIGLWPVGSATLLENFDLWLLGRKKLALIDAIADPNLRELVRDFVIDQRLRCDVFARDCAVLDETEQRRRLLDRTYALTRPQAAVAFETSTPAGRLICRNKAATAIVAALANGPRPLAAIAARIADADLLANALLLCTTGDIRPVEPTRAPVAVLNQVLRGRLGGPEEIAVLALPCGTALDIDHTLRGLLGGADQGSDWPAFLSSHGC